MPVITANCTAELIRSMIRGFGSQGPTFSKEYRRRNGGYLFVLRCHACPVGLIFKTTE